jgi:hypothetical protein
VSPVYWDFTFFSGITGGLSAGAGGENRPTIGLPVFESMAARRVD